MSFGGGGSGLSGDLESKMRKIVRESLRFTPLSKKRQEKTTESFLKKETTLMMSRKFDEMFFPGPPAAPPLPSPAPMDVGKQARAAKSDLRARLQKARSRFASDVSRGMLLSPAGTSRPTLSSTLG